MIFKCKFCCFDGIILFILLCVNYLSMSYAQIEGIYCGSHNCYDVLKVTRDDDRLQIRKSYRELAKKHHPDKQKTAEDRMKADAYFTLINTAYEILSNPEQRKEYDYMLDNPDEMMYNYYQYYRRQYTTDIDVRLVILSLILIISTVQYASQRTSYNQALSHLLKDPKHRTRAKQLASADGRLHLAKREVTGRRFTRDELKDREEELLKEIIKDTVDLRGDCSKPSFRRVLLFQILLFPWTCLVWLNWARNWVWSYWILRRQYDKDAQIFITRRRLGFSAVAWEGLGEEQQLYYMNKELWIRSKYQDYLDRKAEETRIKAAGDSNQKRFRRLVKKLGRPPQASFDDLDM